MQEDEQNIFSMLKSAEGHARLISKLERHLKDQPWASIDHMNRALNEDKLFIPMVATTYSGAPDGKCFISAYRLDGKLNSF